MASAAHFQLFVVFFFFLRRWRSKQPGQMFAGGGSRGVFLFLQKQPGQQLVNEWVRRPDEQSVYISHSHLASARNLYLRRRNLPFFTLFVSPSSSRHITHLQLIKSQPGRGVSLLLVCGHEHKLIPEQRREKSRQTKCNQRKKEERQREKKRGRARERGRVRERERVCFKMYLLLLKLFSSQA